MRKVYQIVIADDEALIAMDLREMLEGKGYHVAASCRDGLEALEAVKKYHPDAVVMDIKMPKLSGLQAAKMIAHDNLAPVVLLTAYGDQSMIEKAKDAGVYGYVMKPIQEKNLFLAIEMAIGRFQKQKDFVDHVRHMESELADEKLISQAKGLLQDYFHISEAEAHRRMQKVSMKRGISLPVLSRKIIREMKLKKAKGEK